MQNAVYKYVLVIVFLGGLSTADVCAVSAGKILGTGKIIYNMVNGFIGKTEVVPAYALHWWKKTSWGYYGNAPFRTQQVIIRTPHTGDFYYETRIFNPEQGFSYIYMDPIYINQLSRLSYRCDLSTKWNKFIFNEVENFVVAVWADKVGKSGFIPPGEPYTAWIKAQGTKLAESCYDNPNETRDFRSDVKVYDSGTSLIQPGWVGYAYNWPMLCWIGDVYDY